MVTGFQYTNTNTNTNENKRVGTPLQVHDDLVVVVDQLERSIRNIQMFIVDPYQLNVNCL